MGLDPPKKIWLEEYVKIVINDQIPRGFAALGPDESGRFLVMRLPVIVPEPDPERQDAPDS